VVVVVVAVVVDVVRRMCVVPLFKFFETLTEILRPESSTLSMRVVVPLGTGTTTCSVERRRR